MVASFAKENCVVTLVGRRTAGQVLGGANFKLSNGYRLRMPVAGWFTWQGECIEGKGVEPDVAVKYPDHLCRGSLVRAHDLAQHFGVETRRQFGRIRPGYRT